MKYLIFTLLFFIKIEIAFSQKIVDWNVHMIINAKNKKSRAIKINQLLLDQKADVVFLQEAFSKSVRKKLAKGFEYSVQPKKKFLKLNSGLLILSHRPVTDIKFYTFKHKRGIDRLCNKGAVRFKIDSTIYVNTHLQNHYAPITESQISELFVFAQGSDIIAGDFNYEDQDYLSLIFNKKIIKTGSTFQHSVIDYVLTNKKIRAHTLNTDLSDHRLILFGY